MPTIGTVVMRTIPFAIIITGLCGLVYATIQQNYRQSLNDPQIQMAEDAAAYLETATSPDVEKIIPSYDSPIDIDSSLATWIAILNPDGTVYEKQVTTNGVFPATSGMFENPNAPGGPSYQYPEIPIGVLQAAASNIGKDTYQPYENRVTWQLTSGVRQAMVAIAITSGSYKGYFVVAGRNMREIENRELSLTFMVGAAWLVLMGAVFVWELLVVVVSKRVV